MKNTSLLIAGLVLVAAGVLGTAGMYLFAPEWSWTPGPWGRGMMGSPRQRMPSTFSSDGQRIYYTATSDTGEPITFTDGPMWLYMHGGSCVACHGPDGRGGFVVPMSSQVAPDIRYSALTTEEHMEQGHEEHPPYTEALIKRAISQGLNPAGEPLSDVMPRWRMSSKELDEVVTYLKSLDKK